MPVTTQAETDSAGSHVRVCLAYDPVETPETAARLARQVALACEKGWRAALDDSSDGTSGASSYVTDARRANYLDLLPLRADQNVLEIGASIGQHTMLIAPRVRSVQALEVVRGQAEFAAVRCEQEGLHNVTVTCGGDDCSLPFEDASFDGVIMNLVFEWCGARNPEGTIAGQRRMLESISRVLRPGGFLWLSTKNRYALRLLMGGRDEHVHGMRFGSALPRHLMELVLRFRGQSSGAGSLYSHNTLKQLIADHGFGEIRSFWAAPEMRHPDIYVSTEASSIRAARRAGSLRQGDSQARRMIMSWVPAPLVKHITPGLAFLAIRGGGT